MQVFNISNNKLLIVREKINSQKVWYKDLVKNLFVIELSHTLHLQFNV